MDEKRLCGGEFGFIKWLSEHCPDNTIPLSIGDDTCVLPGEESILASSDMLVEDVHFSVLHAPARLIGIKTVRVNISDIAAMGGRALYFLLSVAVPKTTSDVWLREFMEGVFYALAQCNVSLVGGDTSASPDKIFVNGTILGRSLGSGPIRRDTASSGDYIYISGCPGEAAAALDALENNSTILAQKTHYSRTPTLGLAAIISSKSIASAMIDTSDGLLGDLGHLTSDCGLGAVLWEDKLPVSPLFKSLVPGQDYLPYMLNGGEDYHLLFTSSIPESDISFQDGNAVYCIGRVTESLGIFLQTRDGKKIPVRNKSFDHFS